MLLISNYSNFFGGVFWLNSFTNEDHTYFCINHTKYAWFIQIYESRLKKKNLVYKICMPPFIHMIHTKYGSWKSYICMIHTYFAWIHSYKSMIRTKICMIHTSVCMNDTKCMIWRCCRYTSAQSFSYNLTAIKKCK